MEQKIESKRSNPIRELLTERTNLRAIISSLLMAFGGCLFIYLAPLVYNWSDNESLKILLQSIGSLLIVSLGLGILQQTTLRRAFLDEIFNYVKLSSALEDAGIIGFSDTFYGSNAPDWASLFRDSTSLDIFFAYGRTWRNVHRIELREIANRKGQIRVILPDPENEVTISELSRRFNYTQKEMISLIQDSQKDFQSLGAQIWFYSRCPLYTVYIFDNSKAVLTLYTHRLEKDSVPTFILKQGKLLDFLINDLNATMHSLARSLEGNNDEG